jgi:hypothetical protein
MRVAALLVMCLVAALDTACAADWGGIDAGVSTMDQVRERYGNPTRQSKPKVEGYDTTQWVYEGDAAPTGVDRLTVDFGLLVSGSFKPSIVRTLTLQPKPYIFGRNTVLEGWGLPDGEGTQNGVDTYFYRIGLFVVFDKEGKTATTLVFGPAQPDEPEKSEPSASPSQAAPPKPATPAKPAAPAKQ